MDPHQRCLELAEQSIGLSEPNPRVGCVIQTLDGRWIEGHTQEAGGRHAEAHALAIAQEKGVDVRGGTAWVSLEPCSHQGRTPPCSQALIGAGLARVIVAEQDPNPLVSGQGLRALENAGVAVELDDGPWSRQAHALNIGFHSRMRRGRPWVRMKMAASLDGVTALDNGTSQWITQEPARIDGHRFRKRAAAILTGIGTVREDDPRLDVRHVHTPHQPLRVVVDSRLEIGLHARILESPGRCLLAAQNPDPAKRAALQALPGVEVIDLPSVKVDGRPTGKTDLNALMTMLADRGINEVHVEAGEKLNGSLLRAGLVDELLVYLAPLMLGRGRGLAAWSDQALESLSEGLSLSFMDVTPLGPDLRLRCLTPKGRTFWRGDVPMTGP